MPTSPARARAALCVLRAHRDDVEAAITVLAAYADTLPRNVQLIPQEEIRSALRLADRIPLAPPPERRAA